MRNINIRETQPLKTIRETILKRLNKLEKLQSLDKFEKGYDYTGITAYTANNRAKKLKPFYFVLSKINKRTKTFNTTLTEEDIDYIVKFIDNNFKDLYSADLIMCLTKPKEDWATNED